jgi:hypothetical protein
MEKIKKHPTHFKITSHIGGILLILTFFSFCVGIYFQQKGQVSYSQGFALSFLIHAVLLISWLVFRMKRCKCPSCGKWLSQAMPEAKDKSRKFICQMCDVVWDTGYVMYFKSDDPG